MLLRLFPTRQMVRCVKLSVMIESALSGNRINFTSGFPLVDSYLSGWSLQEENARKAYEKAERGMKLGSVSLKARNKAKNAYTIAGLQKKQSDLKLTEEYLDYRAGVNGLAMAE